MVSQPLDLGFTNWVSYPASPSDVGAADFNRIQNDLTWLASPPSASLHYTGTAIYASSFTYSTLQWNNAIWANTTGMVSVAMNLTHPTDRIAFPYPGKYRCQLTMRTQFSNTSGLAQAQLIYTDTSGDQVADGAEKDCNSTFPRWLKCEYDIVIDASHIANGASIRGQFVQNSGGDATVTTSPLGAYPRLTVTWIGNS
jgi:hypothetical protein